MGLFASFPTYVVMLQIVAASAVSAFAQDRSCPVLQTLVDLWSYEHRGRPQSQRIAFEFPESLVNRYLALSLKLNPRPCLKNLVVELLPENRIAATAGIDYDLLLRDAPGLIPGNLRTQLLRSNQLKAEFHFLVKAGVLTFEVKPMPLDGLNVPAPALEKIVYRIAALQPEKIDASAGVPVPFGLKRLSTARGLLAGATY